MDGQDVLVLSLLKRYSTIDTQTNRLFFHVREIHHPIE